MLCVYMSQKHLMLLLGLAQRTLYANLMVGKDLHVYAYLHIYTNIITRNCT